MGSDTPTFGVYVHVPFCAKRCDYCAFATWTDRMHLVEAYLDACVADIGRAVDLGLPEATSVFFGGGTPSLVPAEALMRVLDHIPLAPGAEVTVECNPDTVDVALLRAYRRGGVNRLSFGVQSMVPHVLASLGRTHDPANVTSSVAAAREAGFDSFNLDLIYGAAGEALSDWTSTLERALALEPPHVSAYGLTVEPGTPLADEPERHPDDDDQADKYLVADRMLADAGLGELRDLELGEAWLRVPAQPPLLVAGGVPRHRVRSTLASRRSALVERAHSRALRRGDHRGSLTDRRFRASR